MTEEPQHQASVAAPERHYNGFWPVLLLSCSLVLILGWEIRVGVLARQNAERLRNQQVRLVEQAKHVQSGLEKLVRGLIDLSASDEAAKKIVTKYRIKIGSNPSMPAPSPSL
jgi:hypothetical protein